MPDAMQKPEEKQRSQDYWRLMVLATVDGFVGRKLNDCWNEEHTDGLNGAPDAMGWVGV